MIVDVEENERGETITTNIHNHTHPSITASASGNYNETLFVTKIMGVAASASVTNLCDESRRNRPHEERDASKRKRRTQKVNFMREIDDEDGDDRYSPSPSFTTHNNQVDITKRLSRDEFTAWSSFVPCRLMFVRIIVAASLFVAVPLSEAFVPSYHAPAAAAAASHYSCYSSSTLPYRREHYCNRLSRMYTYCYENIYY